MLSGPNLVFEMVIDRSQNASAQTRRIQNMFQQIHRGGLAVGSGHSKTKHSFGGATVEICSQSRQSLTAGIHTDQKPLLGHFTCELLIHDSGECSRFQSLAHVFVPISLHSFKSDKNNSWCRFPAIGA